MRPTAARRRCIDRQEIRCVRAKRFAHRGRHRLRRAPEPNTERASPRPPKQRTRQRHMIPMAIAAIFGQRHPDVRPVMRAKVLKPAIPTLLRHGTQFAIRKARRRERTPTDVPNTARKLAQAHLRELSTPKARGRPVHAGLTSRCRRDLDLCTTTSECGKRRRQRPRLVVRMGHQSQHTNALNPPVQQRRQQRRSAVQCNAVRCGRSATIAASASSSSLSREATTCSSKYIRASR